MCSVCLHLGLLCGWAPRVSAAWVAYSQRLDGLQRSKEPLADGLQLVVIQGEQVEVLQVLEGVHSQAVDLVGIEEAAGRREVGECVILVIASRAKTVSAPGAAAAELPVLGLVALSFCCNLAGETAFLCPP